MKGSVEKVAVWEKWDSPVLMSVVRPVAGGADSPSLCDTSIRRAKTCQAFRITTLHPSVFYI